MTAGPMMWFLNRGTGLALLSLLTLAMLLGVLSMRARAGGRVPGFVVQSVHRNVSLLALALLAVHVTTAVADEYVDIRWWQSFVPWGSVYQPFWLALGTVALDLSLAVVVTSLLRDRIGHRTWQFVHLSTYAAWGFGVVHGLGIGTDTGEPWARWTYLGSGVLVATSAMLRLTNRAATRTEAQRQGVAP